MHVRLLLALQEIRAARDEAVRSARKEAQRQEERLASQLGLTQQLQREAHSRMARLHSSMSYTRFPHAPPSASRLQTTHSTHIPPTHRLHTATKPHSDWPKLSHRALGDPSQ